MEHLGFKIEVKGLWIKDIQSWFEDSIMPHQQLINLFFFVLCRKSRYFEDIVKFLIFRLRAIYNFFQVWKQQSTFFETPEPCLKFMHSKKCIEQSWKTIEISL